MANVTLRARLGDVAVNHESTGTRRSLLEVLRAPDAASVVIGASKDPNAKITVLMLAAGDTRPTVAVKAPTTAVAEAAVVAEIALLRALHERIEDDQLLATIPRVVELIDFRGAAAMATTALAGTPMTTLYHRWRHLSRPASVTTDFHAVGAWLAWFQQATIGPVQALEMDGGTVRRLHDRFREEADIGALSDRLRRIHDRLRRSSAPRTAVHGDLWYGNVLVRDRTISGVVDWEAGASVGEPLRDLVRFPLIYALYLDRHTRPGRPVAGHPGLRAGSWGTGIEYALEGKGWFPELFREFLQAGLDRLGAARDCWRDAAVAGIAEIAATTDDLDFGRHHLQLFRRLTDR
jgi:aminoglycoside phosphotransferase